MKKRMLNLFFALGCVCLLMFGASSCSKEDPKSDTPAPPNQAAVPGVVKIKFANKLSATEMKSLKKELKSYDSKITSQSHVTMNGKTAIVLAPVATDAEAFAAKIKCGKVISTEGNVITLDVDTKKLDP